jgi:hypothetical protein
MSKRLLLIIYLVFSFLDYFFTTKLIISTQCNIEENPFASQIFSEFGFVGMAIYKLANVSLVCLLLFALQLTSRGKKYIKPLLVFACLVLTIILGYSVYLLIETNLW